MGNSYLLKVLVQVLDREVTFMGTKTENYRMELPNATFRR
jgi:hypothetical protein